MDKASLSKSGRTSLSIITKDLRNAGYKNKHYTRSVFDRSIEQVDNYNGTGADSLVLWYNTSANERLRIPMVKNKRSLNLASSVAVVLSECIRQTKNF